MSYRHDICIECGGTGYLAISDEVVGRSGVYSCDYCKGSGRDPHAVTGPTTSAESVCPAPGGCASCPDPSQCRRARVEAALTTAAEELGALKSVTGMTRSEHDTAPLSTEKAQPSQRGDGA